MCQMHRCMASHFTDLKERDESTVDDYDNACQPGGLVMSSVI